MRQQQEMEELNLEAQSDEDEDTIDQDVSSLTSYEEMPKTAALMNSSSVDSALMPSWASTNNSNSGENQVTVKERKQQQQRNLDEIPIQSAKKTFEELLQEQLGLDDSSPRVFEKRDPKKKSGAASFLRKGSGLARYGNVKSPKRFVRRSKSQSNVNNTSNNNKNYHGNNDNRRLAQSSSCTKLDQRPTKSILKKPPSSASATATPAHCFNDEDSVEVSFREKLLKADAKAQKEIEDLAAFEMLEEVAADSSFCSQSSKVKEIISRTSMSPISRAFSATSTPIMSHKQRKKSLNNDGDDDESIDQSLVNDIQHFLESKGAKMSDRVEYEDEDEDEDTFKNLDEGDEADKEVRFEDVENEEAAMEFSPPRVSRHSPSYLIWSIFTKEREERERKKKQQQQKRPKSPLSQVQMKSDANFRNEEEFLLSSSKEDFKFENVLLNSKLTELQNEVEKFKKENVNLQNFRRKLNSEKKKLAEDIQEFEKKKETERKKIEEEKRRLKRDKAMLEKSAKEKKTFEGEKREMEEMRGKTGKMKEEMNKKEAKFVATLNKLQEQIKYLERENQILHEENHKLKLKNVSSKISTQNNAVNGNNKPVTEVKIQEIPSMSFSPADSLDSSITLVPNSRVPSEAALSNPNNTNKKILKEQILEDGSLEILYQSGNRKVISGDKKKVLVHYYNGDVKESDFVDGIIKYYYAEAKTWHYTYPDKTEVFKFNK